MEKAHEWLARANKKEKQGVHAIIKIVTTEGRAKFKKAPHVSKNAVDDGLFDLHNITFEEAESRMRKRFNTSFYK